MLKYESARLKIDRGREHIQNFALLAAQAFEGHELVIEKDQKTGNNIVKLPKKEPPKQLSLIFGDAVTCIRSALDHGYADAIGAQYSDAGQLSFPIRKARNDLIATIQKEKKHCIPKVLYDVIIDDVRPHGGHSGHQSLIPLNNLSNINKHRTLIVFISSGGIVFHKPFRHGNVVFENIIMQSVGNEEFVAVSGPGPVVMQEKPKVFFEILIDEHKAFEFYRKPVIPTLQKFADDASAVIDKLERACP